MRALLQRVTEASVLINGQEVAHTQAGLLIFLGVAVGDTEDDARYLVDKTVNLRIFADGQNRFDRSALDVRAEFLLVSQFTLHADTRRGRRPDFTRAAPADEALRLYEHAVELFRETGLEVATRVHASALAKRRARHHFIGQRRPAPIPPWLAVPPHTHVEPS